MGQLVPSDFYRVTGYSTQFMMGKDYYLG